MKQSSPIVLNEATGTQSKNGNGMIAGTTNIRPKRKRVIALTPGQHEGNVRKTPEVMMQIIAGSLNMPVKCYKIRSRKREIVELRFVTAMLMRVHFPYTTLQQIAQLFGGQDHSSVISGLARAYSLIYSKDISFTAKYKSACSAVDAWLAMMTDIAA